MLLWTRRRGSISVDSISSVAANLEPSYQDHKELIFYQTNHLTFVQFFTLSFDSTSQFAFSAWGQWSKEKNFLLNEKYRTFELLCWKNKASIFVHTSVTLGSETKLKLIKMERHTRDVRDEVRDSSRRLQQSINTIAFATAFATMFVTAFANDQTDYISESFKTL